VFVALEVELVVEVALEELVALVVVAAKQLQCDQEEATQLCAVECFYSSALDANSHTLHHILNYTLCQYCGYIEKRTCQFHPIYCWA
jgi:hypothetical protein